MVGLGLLLLLLLVAVTSVVWTPYPIYLQGTATPYAGPSPTHLAGVDHAGRDLLSRLMVGGRISLLVAFGTQTLAIPVGLTLGFIAGFRGGLADSIISSLINFFYSIPSILVALLLVLVLGGGVDKIIIAIAATSWMDIARLARAQMLALRERAYVDAARAAGISDGRIIVRHILPNAVGPLIVQATYGFAAAILYEAFLSYLGLGVAPPTPSWGSIAADGFTSMRIAPHILAFAATALGLTLIAISFVGDGLRNALDPGATS